MADSGIVLSDDTVAEFVGKTVAAHMANDIYMWSARVIQQDDRKYLHVRCFCRTRNSDGSFGKEANGDSVFWWGESEDEIAPRLASVRSTMDLCAEEEGVELLFGPDRPVD